MRGSIKHIFVGSNTAVGYFSLVDSIVSQQEARTIFILKGAPGASKSNFMKKIGEAIIDENIDVEYYHSSYDPNLLDGLFIPSLKIALLDGSFPNALEPVNLGVVDNVLDFGVFLSPEKLYTYKNSILSLNEQIDRSYVKALFYLEAADALYRQYLFTMKPTIQTEEKLQFERELLVKLQEIIPNKNVFGNSRTLFGSAITGEGVVDYIHTLIGRTETIYLFKETLSCNTKELMQKLKDLLVYNGYNIECYISPLDVDKIEDIIIPELSLAFTTNNNFHKPKIFPTHIIDFTNFIKPDVFKEAYSGADKDFKFMMTLQEKATQAIASAKKYQDALEIYYNDATNEAGMEEQFALLLADILSETTIKA
ncbi:MAG: hypothetical protein ATN36_04245 [Epulopiscium sp. Nele67-Bin005]|nr:MAG: hypothetical protein ATN36_04245 [Epulopiscium sp. Nele67-Bin005]